MSNITFTDNEGKFIVVSVKYVTLLQCNREESVITISMLDGKEINYQCHPDDYEELVNIFQNKIYNQPN